MGFQFTKETKDAIKQQKKREEINREWYCLQSILGYQWAIFYYLLGGREAGKSYAVTNFYVNQWKRYGRPFYWLRLTEASQKKLLQNNAEKLIDPDLRRKYNLDIVTKGDAVYEVIKRDKNDKVIEKKLMARVLALSTFYNDKGSGLFDKDFINDPNMYYNLCLDEMNRESNEKNTFDIVYAFANQLENLIRSTKTKIRVICIGNTLEEAGDILCAMNFIPDKFGRYKLVKNKRKLMAYINEMNAAKDDKERAAVNKRYKGIDFGKRAVIEYIEPNEKYLTRRQGTVADILSGSSSTFTNEIEVNTELVYKGKLKRPSKILMFSKEKSHWFVVWEGMNGKMIVGPWSGESVRRENYIAMRPYLHNFFNKEVRDGIFELFDTQGFLFRSLSVQKMFQKELALLRPRK